MSLRDALFGALVAVCALALIWPGYTWFGNSVRPFVLGLPLSFAWVVGWILVSFGGIALYEATRPGGR